MDKIYKKIMGGLLFVASAVSLSSCFGDSKKDTTDEKKEKEQEVVPDDAFSITTSSTTYRLGAENPEISISVASGYVLNTHSISNIKFTFESNTCDATITKKASGNDYEFKATKLGEAVFYASIGDLKSNNTITITSVLSDDTIYANLSGILSKEGGVVLGESYDLGIAESEREFYSLVGAEGILEINSNGRLEVVGIGQGKVTLKYKDRELKTSRYSVFNSTLATKIKEDLIAQGKIEGKSSLVTHDLFDFVTQLDMSGELINDPGATFGIKYFKNLQRLDLSSNGLNDASFISSLTNLKELNLANNNFSSLSSIEEIENLVKLDISNNKVKSIGSLQFLYHIEYLDLTNNEIENISPLSSCYSLKSLFLNNNKVQNFKDSISGLEDLTELGIGNCGIQFVDIISLKYLPNLEYLDISGTKPTLKTISTTLTKLKTLILDNCCLESLSGDDSLEYLNELKNLEILDLSHNNLDTEKWFKEIDTPYIQGENFKYLIALYLGGNDFDTFPSLDAFKNLSFLDVSESNNLTDVSTLAGLPLETLIIDNCNSISNPDFADLILANDKIKNLSTVGAFNFLDRDNFDKLSKAVSDEKLTWRFLTDVWTNSRTVSNYASSVFFSANDFISNTCSSTQGSEGNCYTINDKGQPELIISLINDNVFLEGHAEISIPKEIKRIQIYGSIYHTYDISFKVLDRKESSLTFNFYNFNDEISLNNGDAIIASVGSRVFINACGGNNVIRGADGIVVRKSNGSDTPIITEPGSAFNGYDIKISSLKGSTISLVGGNGGKGPNHTGALLSSGAWRGMDGGVGATAIRCHDCTLSAGKMTITGGNGGNGGTTYNDLFSSHKNGKGGDGGNGISYSGTFVNNADAKINGGIGGKQGSGGKSNVDGTNGSSSVHLN